MRSQPAGLPRWRDVVDVTGDGLSRDAAAAGRDREAGGRDREADERDEFALQREELASQREKAVRDRMRAQQVMDGPRAQWWREEDGEGDLGSALEQSLIDREAALSCAEWAREELREVLDSSRAERRNAVDDRRASEQDRERAAGDRESSTTDREAAAADREQAQVDAQLVRDPDDAESRSRTRPITRHRPKPAAGPSS